MSSNNLKDFCFKCGSTKHLSKDPTEPIYFCKECWNKAEQQEDSWS